MYSRRGAIERWKTLTNVSTPDPPSEHTLPSFLPIQPILTGEQEADVHSHFMLYTPDLTAYDLAPFRQTVTADDQPESRAVTQDDMRNFTKAVLRGDPAAVSLAAEHLMITPWFPGNPQSTRVKWVEPGRQWRQRNRMMNTLASIHRSTTEARSTIEATTGDENRNNEPKGIPAHSMLEACQDMRDMIEACGDGDEATKLHGLHLDKLASRPDSISEACLDHGIDLGEVFTDLCSRVSQTIYANQGDDRPE